MDGFGNPSTKWIEINRTNKFQRGVIFANLIERSCLLVSFATSPVVSKRYESIFHTSVSKNSKRYTPLLPSPYLQQTHTFCEWRRPSATHISARPVKGVNVMSRFYSRQPHHNLTMASASHSHVAVQTNLYVTRFLLRDRKKIIL